MKIIEDVKYDFSDVLIMPKRSTVSSRVDVELRRSFKWKYSSAEYKGVPICVANMDVTGTIEMAEMLKWFGIAVALHKFYTVEQLVEYFARLDRNPYAFYTMGITNEDFEKFQTVVSGLRGFGDPNPISYVCIDVANGYSRKFVAFVEKMRNTYPHICIMAGNVVTADMTYDLLERGADIVKIGIGSGSVCTTRKLTGVGFPQLSATIECADAAHGVGGMICSDGGITCPGDIAKAFGAGADFVMAGGLFAGHEECGGELIGDKMRFYGMSSKVAMDKHYGGKAEYRASEGKVVEVPFKGSVDSTAKEILGGLRSACTYVGANKLKDLPKCTTFLRVNRTLNESLSQYNV